MKFGFIAHINNNKEKSMLKILRQFNQLSILEVGNSNIDGQAIEFVQFKIKSAIGAECEGKIVYLPWYPHDIIENSEVALEKIKEIVLELEAWGADVIGLGGYTACIGGRGVEVQNILKKAKVTTGNAFTATTTVDTFYYITDKIGVDIANLNIALIGFPGSILLVIAKLLMETKAKLHMVGRRNNIIVNKYFPGLSDDSNVFFSTDLQEVVSKADVVISATTTGLIIQQDWLQPGAIVLDVGEPKDVIKDDKKRNDILIVDGGRFGFTDEVEFINMPFNSFFRSGFFGCIGETVLLALEENLDYCSLGRELSIEKVKKISEIGKQHGFIVNGLSSWGENISDSEIENVRNILLQKYASKDEFEVYKRISNVSKEEILQKYAKYVNSVIVAVTQSGNYDRLYVKAKGLYVWDNEGNKYYDFVGGYGSVNIGHNHPVIFKGIKKYMEISPPSILQVVPGYFATSLATALAEILPGNINKLFFCNSGTESVEGALKLARIYTGRTKYLSTYNSFHGKTYGSLSVTGREKYQKYFRPLLNEVDFVEYNNISCLEEKLMNNDVAAMILEPIQGEGGVIEATPEYLRACLEICHKYGTLLIVDEVQTGFGRTGKMFAVEHAGIVPDIIACSKSLGGGLIPIGTYATTEEIWNTAYGNQSKYLLHTSTFGGNSFCSSVAINAINVIQNEGLIENAKEIGDYLIDNLREIASDYHFIKEVRGKGLLIGIEFIYSVKEGMTSLLNMIYGMVPVKFKNMISAFSNEIVESVNQFLDDTVENVEKYFADNFASQFAAALLNDYNIITIVTLNNPYVIRIEPPLLITKDEADYFLKSFKKVCEKYRLLDGEFIE
jgi:3-acetyloctanal aminotransferase